MNGGWKPHSATWAALCILLVHLELTTTLSEKASAVGMTRWQLKAIRNRLRDLSNQLERSPAWKKELGKFFIVEYCQTADSVDGDDTHEKLKSAPVDKQWFKVILHVHVCNGPGCCASTKETSRCQGCLEYDHVVVFIY